MYHYVVTYKEPGAEKWKRFTAYERENAQAFAAIKRRQGAQVRGPYRVKGGVPRDSISREIRDGKPV